MRGHTDLEKKMEPTINAEWADRRKGLDPLIYKPKFYVLDVPTKSIVNGDGAASIQLDETPFVLDNVTHLIVGETPANQDGQYSILWRDNQTTYMNSGGMSESLFGSVRSGYIIPLPLRVFYPSSKTLSVEIINYIDRTATFPTTFPLQIVFRGFEKWSRPRI